MFVMITYDVVEKRTEKFRSLLCRYLVHEQNSVFSGVMTGSSMKTLRSEINDLTITGDSVMIVTARNKHNVDVERMKADERGQLMPADATDSVGSTIVV